MRKLKLFFESYKTPIFFSSTALIKAVAQLLVGFVIAKYISPEDFGVWTGISLLLTYSGLLQGGLINGLNLELPLAFGKGKEKYAYFLAGTVQTSILFCSLFVFFGGLFYFIFSTESNPMLSYGILGISFVGALTFYQNYLLSTFRSSSSFNKLSKIQIFDAIFNLLSIIIVIRFLYYGLIVKSILSLSLFVLILHYNRPIKTSLVWDLRIFKRIFFSGLPIFGLATLDSFSSTIDKLWLIKYADITEVGLYSFGFYGYTLFLLFSASIASYVYPRMSYTYGRDKNRIALWKFVKKVTIFLFAIQLSLSILGIIAIPYIISNFFPTYIDSIRVMLILLVAGVFKGSVVGVNSLWSMKIWKYIIFYQFFNSLATIFFTYLGANYFLNKAIGVGLGVLFSNVLIFILGIGLIYLATHKKNEISL